MPRTPRHLIWSSYHRVTRQPGDKTEALHQSGVELATRVSNVARQSEASGRGPLELGSRLAEEAALHGALRANGDLR
jgi:hypothetical protein